MTREVSQRRYRNEAAFRQEVERRFGAEIPDRIWDETGGSVWRDQEIERGYAVEAAVRSVLIEVRHRRSQGDLPALPSVMRGQPRDAWKWHLRSLFLSRLVQDRVVDWRRSYLPKSLDELSFSFHGAEGGIVAEVEPSP